MKLTVISRTFRVLPIPVRWAALAATGGILAWAVWPAGMPSLPTAVVQAGEFIVDLKEAGKLRAENSVLTSTPPARVNLQIVGLVPEGTQVKEGDFLIQFDTTELRQQLDDQLAELDIAHASLIRSQASMASHRASLESSLENSRASYRLAELRLDQMKFEADVRLEEGRLSLKQAEISLRQAEGEIQAQRQIDSADVRSLELKVKQAEFDLQKTRLDLSRLRIHAPRPGLVVYKQIWRGGEMSKIKVGDTPWRGSALIELPDLSVMLVETDVNEVDVGKVKVGQEAEVKLDAYPDPTFRGEVTEVAVLARDKEGSSEAQVFNVLVRLKESDPLLRPGMSATIKIIVGRLPDKLWAPIESVFDRGGKMVAYAAASRGFKQREVKLGDRNDNFVVVDSGLSAGERVALVDPTAETLGAAAARNEAGQGVGAGGEETPPLDPPRKRGGGGRGRR